MLKTANCETCLYYAHNSHLVCAVHPSGHDSNSCPDFQADPDIGKTKFVDFLGLLQIESNRNSYEPHSDEEQWQPEGATYYNGELILQREEKLWLQDNYPLFNSTCPSCKYHFPQANLHVVHFDCPNCGWVDDSI